MADINIQEVTNHINIETANGYKLEFNGPVVNMNVVLSNYYTKTETDALLNDKADKADTYTKSETNILLNDKADKADTYTISQINGMVRDINTTIGTKQNLITGAASTITNSNLTTNRAVISNARGKVAVSNVTSTELGYLSGVTSAVQTQLNNKASTSLDNLSATGQMIIDSQNGTISNCVLEIPQNIKVTLENNVLTLKSGSECVVYGSTYQTVTKGSDLTRVFSNSGTNRTIVIMPNTILTYIGFLDLSHITSGESFPSDLPSSGQYGFYKVSEKQLYETQDGGTTWSVSGRTYPICIINIDSNGVASFAKDSNGNDMIFNGAGFIGHHAFIYPNVKALIPNGLNANGSLKSTSITNNALQIVEMGTNANRSICFLGSQNVGSIQFVSVKNKSDLVKEYKYQYQYCEETNSVWLWNNNAWSENTQRLQFIPYTYDGTTVTDFTIRQPVRTATVEMLNNTLGDIETLLASI